MSRHVYTVNLVASLGPGGAPQVDLDIRFADDVSPELARAYLPTIPETLRSVAAQMEAAGPGAPPPGRRSSTSRHRAGMSESPLPVPEVIDEPNLPADVDPVALAECMARHPAGKQRHLSVVRDATGEDR